MRGRRRLVQRGRDGADSIVGIGIGLTVDVGLAPDLVLADHPRRVHGLADAIEEVRDTRLVPHPERATNDQPEAGYQRDCACGARSTSTHVYARGSRHDLCLACTRLSSQPRLLQPDCM